MVARKSKPKKKVVKAKEIPDPVDEKRHATLAEAAAHCRVTIRTLRNYYSKFPDMPFDFKSKKHGESWSIDLEALDAWRRETGLLTTQEEFPEIAGGAKPIIKGQEDGRHKKIQADLLQMEYDQKMGKLVDKEAAARLFSQKFVTLGKTLEQLPNWLAKKCNLPPETVELLIKRLDEARAAFSRDNDGFLAYITEENSVTGTV